MASIRIGRAARIVGTAATAFGMLLMAASTSAATRSTTLVGPAQFVKEAAAMLEVDTPFEAPYTGDYVFHIENLMEDFGLDNGDIFIDDERIAKSLDLRTSDFITDTCSLDAGPHLLRVRLRGPAKGPITIDVQAPYTPLATDDVWITYPQWGLGWDVDVAGTTVEVDFDYSGTAPTTVELWVNEQPSGFSCSTSTKQCFFNITDTTRCSYGIQLKYLTGAVWSWSEPIGFMVRGTGIPECRPRCNSCQRQDGAALGEPVDVVTGEVFLTETDFGLSGPFPINFQRYYSSQDNYNGPLGQGWRHNYDLNLEFRGSGGNPRPEVYFINEEGHRVAFNKIPNYAYPADPTATYFPNPFYQMELRWDSAQSQYRIHDYQKKLVYSFGLQADGVFRLLSIKDQGNLIQFCTYNTNATRSQITKINYFDPAMFNPSDGSFGAPDFFDKGLSFTYSGTRISQIQTLVGSSCGGTKSCVSFGYTGSNLTSRTDARAKVWTYEYNDPTWPSALTARKNPLGQAIETHTYDGSRRALTSARQGGVEAYAFEYGVPSPIQTRVTDARSNQTIYSYDPAYQGAAGEQLGLVTKIAGPGCNCGGAAERNLEWNAYRRKVRDTVGTGGEATTTFYEYHKFDRLGQFLSGSPCALDPSLIGPDAFELGPLFRVTEAEGTGDAHTGTHQTLVEKLCAHVWNDYSLPWRIRRPSADTIGQQAMIEFDYQKALWDSCPQNCFIGCTTFQTFYYSNKISETRTGYSQGAAGAAQTTTWAYNHYQQVTQINGPRTDVSDITTFTYAPNWAESSLYDVCSPSLSSNLDQAQQLTRITDAAGNQTNYPSVTTSDIYDHYGNATRVQDPNNVETQYSYDKSGLRTQTRVQGSPILTTSFTYDDASRLTDVTLPKSNAVHYVYDTGGRQTDLERRTALATPGDRIHSTYDLMSNKTKEEKQRWNGLSYDTFAFTDYEFDGQNRLFRITPAGAGPTEYTEQLYDSLGRLSTIKDGRHPKDGSTPTTTYTYDHRSRMLTRSDRLGVGAITTTFTYDADGNTDTATDPNGNVTTYEYDDFGVNRRTTSRVFGNPGPESWTYSYDTANNLKVTTDANGDVENRTYDVLNRLKTVTYPADSSLNITYNYDASAATFTKGRLSSIVGPSAFTQTYQYERRGLRTLDRFTIAAVNYDFLHTYDNNGNRLSTTYPSGRPVAYGFDLLDRLNSIRTTVDGVANTALVSAASYLPFGPLSFLKFEDSCHDLHDERGFDQRYRLTSLRVSGLLQRNYPSYDPENNILEIDDLIDSANNRTFAHDDLQRLTAATGPYLSETYTYDSIGNRLTKNTAGNLTTYNYSSPGAPRLISATGAEPGAWTYDDNGAVTSDGVHAYGQSKARRLANVDGGATATYLSDADARRRVKTTPSATTRYFYVEGGNVGADLDVATGTWTEYFWLGNRPVARIKQAAGHLELDALDTASLRANKTGVSDIDITWVNATAYQSDLHRDTSFTFFTNSTLASCAAGTPASYTDANAQAAASNYAYRAFRCINEKLEYIFTDHLNTPIRMADVTHRLTWSAEHYPFGGIFSQSAPELDFRFPGQREDAETGLFYNWNRHYSARSSRFYQMDPLWSADNAYEYAKSRPLRSTDPQGLYAIDNGGPNEFPAKCEAWARKAKDNIERRTCGCKDPWWTKAGGGQCDQPSDPTSWSRSTWFGFRTKRGNCDFCALSRSPDINLRYDAGLTDAYGGTLDDETVHIGPAGCRDQGILERTIVHELTHVCLIGAGFGRRSPEQYEPEADSPSLPKAVANDQAGASSRGCW